MNPFNKILEATSFDTTTNNNDIIVPTTNNIMQIETNLSTTTSTIKTNKRMDSNNSKSTEVNELIKQLKDIVGDFDTTEILYNLSQQQQLQSYNNINKIDCIDNISNNLDNKPLNKVKFDDNHYQFVDKHIHSSVENGNHIIDDDNNNIKHIIELGNINNNHKSISINRNSLHKDRKSNSIDSDVLKGNHTLLIESQRYSLGVNRFSINANKLSSSTLNYINKDKILSASSRNPATTATATMNVSKSIKSTIQRNRYSYVHSNLFEQHIHQPTLATETTETALNNNDNNIIINKSNKSIHESEIFTEFCEIGISSNILSGIHPLHRSNLQPTVITNIYPESKQILIDNINEYCFPNGAQLCYYTQKELDVLRNSSTNNSLKFQIMQYTDATNTIYYATSVITIEPIYDNIQNTFINNLSELTHSIQAANIIKKNISYYFFSKKRKIEKDVSEEWCKNIEINRSRQSTSSIADTVESHDTMDSLTSDNNNRKKKSKSMFKSFRKIISSFNGKKLSSSSSSTSSRKNSLTNSNNIPINSVISTANSNPLPPSSSTSLSTSMYLSNYNSLDSKRNPSIASENHEKITNSPTDDSMSLVINGEIFLREASRKSLTDKDDILVADLNDAIADIAPIDISLEYSSDSSSSNDNDRTDKDRAFQGIGKKDSGNILEKRVSKQPTIAISSPIANKDIEDSMLGNPRKIAIVTEKAYCILSTKPYHVLFFQILEAIAMKERENAFQQYDMYANDIIAAIHDGYMFYHTPIPSFKSSHSLKSITTPQDSTKSTSSTTSTTTSFWMMKRNQYLSFIQSYDVSSILKNNISNKNNHHKTINNKNNSSSKLVHDTIDLNEDEHLQTIDLSMPDCNYIKKLKIPLKFLKLKEWTTALLITIIPTEIILKILCILLQEQSLLVYGSDPGLVTAISTACMLILQPFTWEGIFVPLLPAAAYEALDAPVPYIIGIVAASRPIHVEIAACAGILCVDDFLYHKKHYIPSTFDDQYQYTKNELNKQRTRSSLDHYGDSIASNIDFVFYENPRVARSDLPNSCGMPILESMLNKSFQDLRHCISYHTVKISESLKQQYLIKARAMSKQYLSKTQAMSTVMLKTALLHMTEDSIRSLRFVLDRIYMHNSSLCGSILSQPAGWLQYGQSTSQGHFDFVPESFIKPLEYQIEFQKNVIHTQLFVSFMDTLSITYHQQERYRIFIRDWIIYHMKYHKKKKIIKLLLE